MLRRFENSRNMEVSFCGMDPDNDLNGAPVLSAAKRSRRKAVEPFDKTQGRRLERLERLERASVFKL